MQHIVAGVDTRETGSVVLVRAADLARRLGARLDVVHVQPLSPAKIRTMVSTVPGRHLAERFLRADQDAQTQEARMLAERTLAGSGVPWRMHVLAGDPAANLLAVADSVDAYAIVIGARREVVLERLLTGSVSHRVVNGAKQPVLLVPAGLDE